MQVELGEKRTVRFKSSNTEFTKFVMENVRINKQKPKGHLDLIKRFQTY